MLIEDYLETIGSESEIEGSYEALYEELQYLLENPININGASNEEFQKLHLLNDFQIASIHNYIKDNGPLLSLNELQLVYGFNIETIEKIKPFITINTEIKDKIQSKYGQHQIITRYSQVLETTKGYLSNFDTTQQSPAFQGSPVKIYTRYNYHYRDRLFWGVTAEKDAGEKFFSGNNPYGYDFYSFHLLYHSPKTIKTIAIGDYHINFGQGLVANTAFSIGKSPDVINLRKYDPGITKYSSTDENHFMRGLATTIRLGSFDVSLFASCKKLDANIIEIDSSSDDVTYTSLLTNGLHTTISEIENKDAITESIAGTNINWKKKNMKMGFTYLHSEYSGSYLDDIKPYKQFIPGPGTNDNAGFNYQLILRKMDLFGEMAINNFDGLAFLNGCMFDIDPMLQISVLHRYYQRNYYAPYGNAFSESSGLTNENGTYFGIQFIPFNKWTFRAYYDFFRFPWLTYSADAPSYGYEYFSEARFDMSENVNMYWRCKLEDKQVNFELQNENLHQLGNKVTKKFRYHISYKIAETLLLSNRIEITECKLQHSGYKNGYLAYQDVQYRPESWPMTIYLRYSLFDIDDFNARIYTYENDALYSYSLPFFNNQGSRFYVMTKLTIKRYLDLWLRYLQTYYTDVSEIGSGWNEIEGNKKSEIKVQVRYRF